MLVITERSLYQIDESNKRVRRLVGIENPTPRMGTDGQWKNYEQVIGVAVGSYALFVWNPKEVPPLSGNPECVTRATTTSKIIEVLTGEEENAHLSRWNECQSIPADSAESFAIRNQGNN